MNIEGLTLNQLAERNAVLVSEVEKLRAERDQLAAENVGMDAFVNEMLTITWQGGDVDGWAIQDLALKHGLIRQEVYCADEHETLVEDPENFEDGDDVYFRVETPATNAEIAGIKADGVEELADRLQKHLDEGDFSANEVGVIAGAIHCGREMAQQLREGAK